jgi:hypothetical protein
MLTVSSGGSERYASGVPVTLEAVSGHRDTGRTECPGDAFYGRLDEIAAAARAIGGPKIFEPRVEVVSEGQVRFRARLSTSLRWEVTVAGGDGAVVASGSGTARPRERSRRAPAELCSSSRTLSHHPRR